MNEMNDTNFNYKELADGLLDYLCEFVGSDSVIQLLDLMGYNADQLEDLGFDRKDIDLIIN